jgi:hypothetical protein
MSRTRSVRPCRPDRAHPSTHPHFSTLWSLNDAECSLNDAECSLNDTERSLNDTECSLNDVDCFLIDAECSLNDAECALCELAFCSDLFRGFETKPSGMDQADLEGEAFRVCVRIVEQALS